MIRLIPGHTHLLEHLLKFSISLYNSIACNLYQSGKSTNSVALCECTKALQWSSHTCSNPLNYSWDIDALDSGLWTTFNEYWRRNKALEGQKKYQHISVFWYYDDRNKPRFSCMGKRTRVSASSWVYSSSSIFFFLLIYILLSFFSFCSL